MKKFFVVISIAVIVTIVTSGCGIFATKEHDAEVLRQACWNMGGLLDKDNKCVLASAQQPTVPQVNVDCGRTGCPSDLAATSVSSGYVCDAYSIGANGGPVDRSGSCSFCTVNYRKPGNVLVVGSTPVEYSRGAWVWQYANTDEESFRKCINGQPFMADPDYTPVWKF